MVATTTADKAGSRDKKRVPRLDGVRGLAAMGVVITHVSFTTWVVMGSEAGDPRYGIWSILAAGLTVSLGPFFILSGMLLYRPFVRRTLAGTPRPKLGSFFARRAARLLPAYWLVVVFSLLFLNFTMIDSAWYVLRPLVLLQNYDFLWYAGLDVTWTVPTEAQFYIMLPILAMITHRLARNVDDPARKARRMLIPLGVLLVIGFAWTAYMHQPELGPWPEVYWWPISRVGLFGLGMALAVVSVLHEVAPEKAPAWYRLAVRRPNLVWTGALLAYAVNCAQPLGTPGTSDYLKPSAALVQHAVFLSFAVLMVLPLVAARQPTRLMEALLSNAVMRYLGRISYGIYLWHFPMMFLWFQSGSIFGGDPIPVQVLRGTIPFWELAIAVVVGTIVLASLSWYLFEKPIINLVERWLRSRQPAATVTPIAGGELQAVGTPATEPAKPTPAT